MGQVASLPALTAASPRSVNAHPAANERVPAPVTLEAVQESLVLDRCVAPTLDGPLEGLTLFDQRRLGDQAQRSHEGKGAQVTLPVRLAILRDWHVLVERATRPPDEMPDVRWVVAAGRLDAERPRRCRLFVQWRQYAPRDLVVDSCLSLLANQVEVGRQERGLRLGRLCPFLPLLCSLPFPLAF
jgi:hypothetical protein